MQLRLVAAYWFLVLLFPVSILAQRGDKLNALQLLQAGTLKIESAKLATTTNWSTLFDDNTQTGVSINEDEIEIVFSFKSTVRLSGIKFYVSSDFLPQISKDSVRYKWKIDTLGSSNASYNNFKAFRARQGNKFAEKWEQIEIKSVKITVKRLLKFKGDLTKKTFSFLEIAFWGEILSTPPQDTKPTTTTPAKPASTESKSVLSSKEENQKQLQALSKSMAAKAQALDSVESSLSKFLAEKGYEQALEELNKYKLLREELEKTQQEMHLMQLDNQLKQEEIEYRAKVFYVIMAAFGFILLIGTLAFLLQIRQKNKTIKLNQQLNEKNKQIALQNQELETANRTILDQMEELQAVNAQISEANQSIQRKTEELKKTHQNIEDSILYAKRIQYAVLPDFELFKQLFNQFGVFYRPRDIVSGDFYWLSVQDDYKFLAGVDCTGHGVPGAFMSVIGNTLLNQIVNELQILTPGAILTELDRRVRLQLKQTDSTKAQDGMDIALLVFDTRRNILTFAGAGRPLYIQREGEIIEYRGSKFPIGGAFAHEKIFEEICIPIQSGDRFFVFSDGVTDQFGGNPKRKFMNTRLKSALLESANKPVSSQVARVGLVFNDWKESYPQMDDVMLLGVEY